MNSKYTITFILCSGLVLGACSSNNGNGGAVQATPKAGKTLAAFGNQAADDDPMAISMQLENDIQAVFGDADNAATDVVAGDTVQTVIDRAQ